MKINRTKRAQKHLQFYCNNFGFREPFQILFDGTFCFNALKNNIQIINQLKKYLQTDIKPLTTACCIIESENLGHKFQATTNILKDFKVHTCGHEKSPISGSNCLKSMSGKSRYIIATQDRDLQDWIRGRPGIPLIYFHQVAPILDAPSEASNRKVVKITGKAMEVTKIQEDRLNFYKKKEGLLTEETKAPEKKKRKVKGGPNPLSCKKKQKKGLENQTNARVKLGKVEKKRKRIKVPKHVKELLLNQNTNNSE